ncbi:MAG TPA: potassium/proton antiporter [Solirubrobacterales bacterium]
MSDANLILITGALLVAGLLATVLAGRLRVPGLVLFLGLGMAIGSDGTGWIDFADYELARTIGVIALALILFEGGLAVGFSEVRPVLGASVALAILGTMLTAAIAGLAASWLFGFSVLEGMLVGSIVSATDGAAIFGLLRDSSLRPRIARTLEGEAGVNDPIAVLLVVGLIDWIELPDYGLGDMVLLFVQELGIGLAVGIAVGWIAVQGLRRASLGGESGYAIGTIGAAAVAFGAASSLHGSGFLAVYLAGLFLGTVPIPAKRAVTLFHQGLAQVSQVAMFVVLGLLVFPSQLGDVALEGTLLALVLMLVARPAATLLATLPFGFTFREKSVLAWAGLRGAIPVVLATFPVIEGVPESLDFFNIVFFAVLLSTLLQGATFEPFAKALGVTSDPEPAPGAAPLPRPPSPSSQILTVRPWADGDGDPGFPRDVLGIEVTRHLLSRLDRPGALVSLADGRYAFTGPLLGVGSASALQAAARRRLAGSRSDAEQSWWREVIGALAR